MTRSEMALATTIAAGYFMEGLDQTILATSLPQIALSLDESPLRLSVAITSYLLALAVFVPISSWVVDRFGARTVYCSAIVLFTCASALAGIAQNFETLVFARILQGVGGSMLLPVGKLIMLRAVPKSRLVPMLAFTGMVSMVGPSLGPLVGGYLSTYASWRWIFFINIPIGLIQIAMALRTVENYRVDNPSTFDVRGFLLIGGGLALLQYGLENLGHGDSSAVQTAVFALAVALITGYVLYARTQDDPILDFRLLRVPTFKISMTVGGLSRIAWGSVLLLPVMLQVGCGLTPMEAGSLTFFTSIGAFLTRTIMGPLLRRFGFRTVLFWTSLATAAAIAALALYQATTPYWLGAALIFALGYLRALQLQCVMMIGVTDIDRAIMGKNTTINAVVQRMTQSLGLALADTIVALLAGAETPALADFQVAFLLLGVLPLISAAGFLRLARDAGANMSLHRPS